MQNHSMTGCRIILWLIVVAGCRPWTPQQFGPSAQPVVVQEYPTTGGAPGGPLPPGSVPIAGPYLQPSPMIFPQGPEIVPIYPPQSTVVPLPSHTPGSIFGPPLEAPLHPQTGQPLAPTGPLSDIAPGGMVSPQFGLPPGPEALPPVASSIFVPVTNDEWAWDQITDVISQYFTITAERPARRGAEMMVEGGIETAPQDGATWLEPQRNDSVGRFNRWESTFQTIRRRAAIRVLPDAAGYTVEIAVDKELEDLPYPERATAGAATFRNDGSLPSSRTEQVSRTRTAPHWISLGRDPPLEQRMLAEIHARMTGVETTESPIFRQ